MKKKLVPSTSSLPKPKGDGMFYLYTEDMAGGLIGPFKDSNEVFEHRAFMKKRGDADHIGRLLHSVANKDQIERLRKNPGVMCMTPEEDRKNDFSTQPKMAKKKIGVIDCTPRPPTWTEVNAMAQAVLEHLGGPPGAADKLTQPQFYTLAYLAALIGKEGPIQ